MKPSNVSKVHDSEGQGEEEYKKNFRLLHRMLSEEPMRSYSNTNTEGNPLGQSSTRVEHSSRNSPVADLKSEGDEIMKDSDNESQAGHVKDSFSNPFDRQSALSEHKTEEQHNLWQASQNNNSHHAQALDAGYEERSLQGDFEDDRGHNDDGDGEDENNEDDEDNEDDEEEEEEDYEDDEDEDGDDFLNLRHRSTLLSHILSRNANNGDSSGFLDVMQNLVSGLGASQSQRTEFDQLIGNLNQREDAYLILESINEISERLLMMDGVTAERVLSPHALSTALVSILKDPVLAEDLELHLVTCRCLYNFIEVNSDFINDALESGAVEALVPKLIDVVYIDLTEQCLQTLEVISQDRASHALIVSNNGIRACLQNLDFLTMHSQRKCLSIVANSCTGISKLHFDYVLNQFANLTGVLQLHTDMIVRESAWLCLSRIIKSYNREPVLLESIFLDDRLLIEMMTVIQNSCNPTTSEIGFKYQTLLSLLNSILILVSSSSQIALRFLDIGVGCFIISSIRKFGREMSKPHPPELKVEFMPLETVSIEALVACPKDVLALFLQLIAMFVPTTISSSECASILFGKQRLLSTTEPSLDKRSFEKNGPLFQNLINEIWSLLIGSFQATMELSVRKQAMACISKIVLFYSNEDLATLKDIDALFGVLSAVVSSGKKHLCNEYKVKEANVVHDRPKTTQSVFLYVGCIIIKDLLQRQMPAYSRSLEREGLFNDLKEIENILSSQDSIDEITSQNSSSQQMEASEHEFTLESKKNSIDPWTDVALPDLIQEIHALGLTNEEVNNFESQNLKLISESLKEVMDQGSADREQLQRIWNLFANILAEHDVSNFEFLNSGVVEQMTNVLRKSDGVTSVRDVAASTLLRTFSVNESFLSKILSLLQTSLNRSEYFDIATSEVPHKLETQGRANSLARQMKLKISFDEMSLKRFNTLSQNLIISVQAIATFKSIESFLKEHFLNASSSLNEFSDDEREKFESDFSPKIQFTVNSVAVSSEFTIFGAVYRSLYGYSNSGKTKSTDLWNSIHQVGCEILTEAVTDQAAIASLEDFEPSIDDKHSESILRLMDSLYHLIKESPNNESRFSPDSFMNWNLTMKLNKQLEEHLIIASGVMPTWCVLLPSRYPFIFPLSTRMSFLRCTSFGISRWIQSSHSRSNNRETAGMHDNSVLMSSQNLPLGIPSRKKVRIKRELIFKSALKLFLDYGDHPGLLEIEYFDEVGSGLGPTLEFYSTVSREFQRIELRLWRHDLNEAEFAFSQQGLFPSPIGSTLDNGAGSQQLFFFNILGRFVARSLHDSRIVDFNFSRLFMKLVQDPAAILDLKIDFDLKGAIDLVYEVDNQLARSLYHLCKYIDHFDGSSNDELIVLDGMTLADLSLTFVIPGTESEELIPGGANVPVSPPNLERYLRLIVDSTVGSGVKKQIQAFREGFTTVFPVSSLSIFFPEELCDILGSCSEDWSRETIYKSIKANHGYSLESEAIVRLSETLEEFNTKERRQFLQFLTGSPRLPIGGFKSMRPEFTVVMKQPDEGLSSDDYLPSVMTCANYLKLPDYSSKAIMKMMIQRAMIEGAGSFHLS